MMIEGESRGAFGSPGYRLIDSDAHINEPPDLWTSRVPRKFQARAPRVERFDRGDGWVMEGAKDPISFGFNAAAAIPFEQRAAWMRWEDVPAGGYDPTARLKDMDTDLVDAAVLYPTPRISQLVVATKEPDLHLALIQAYNDWLSEFCASDPSRLGGLMLVPNRGVAEAVKEIQRVAGRPGIVGALIGCYPHGDVNLEAQDDDVWRAVVDAEMALHIHVRLSTDLPEDLSAPGLTVTEGRARGDLRFLQAPVIMLQLLTGGVFDRVPDLRVVLAEVDAGWVPFMKEQVDNRFLRKSPRSEIRRRELPSAQIARHFYYTYLTDHFAIKNRHSAGVDRLMWSSDYPHSGTDWPVSINVIQSSFADVPSAERDLILGGNAQRLYRFRCDTANSER